MASLIDSDLGSLSVEQQRRLGLTLENVSFVHGWRHRRT
jgi:hypothetical protein